MAGCQEGIWIDLVLNEIAGDVWVLAVGALEDLFTA